VRLLGVRVTGLAPAAIQLTMFGDDPLRRHRLNHALDDLAARYNAGLVIPARVARQT